MKNLTIKVKLYIILAIVSIGSIITAIFVNSKFSEIAAVDPRVADILTAINIDIAVLMVVNTVIVFVVASQINVSIQSLAKAVGDFFGYLEHKTDTFEPIEIKNHDEIGDVSNSINEHAAITKDMLSQDKIFLDDLKRVLTQTNKGCFSQHVVKSPSTPVLNEIKTLINDTLENQESRFLEINKLLEEYTNQDFRRELKIEGIVKEGVFEGLVQGINHLHESINSMLRESKSNGLTLDRSSDILLENIDLLSRNSNDAAAALEETAAAIEEITSNIQGNTQNVIQMAQYASEVTSSVNTGQTLAKQTTESMDEINDEVTAIHEAITVIDQIAFQTNILSLNAAVEAATAGEAGKGFAVVAGEVRNLASRSAEAANEIKTLVENATAKANSGKSIADRMIHGYKDLNKNISSTIELIKDVEDASKEQQAGIMQINDAINSLDQQTQTNASIANHTHEIAIETDIVAKLVVINANEKEFNGKDSVRAKEKSEIPTDIKSTAETLAMKEVSKSEPQQEDQPSAIPEVKNVQKIQPITPEDESDEWTSF